MLRTLLPLLMGLLAGCAQENDMAELQQFVDQQLNRPPGPIEPLPRFTSYQPFTYSAAGLRSPFEAPVDISAALRAQTQSDVQPDENRPREALESFNLSNLRMVGSLARGNTTWALIRDENGEVHDVMAGNYMGRNHGRIVSVTPTQIDLIEIVPSGDGGWIERPQTISLQGDAAVQGEG